MAAPVYTTDLEGCRSVELEGLTIFYHGRSGTTHILAPPSPDILDALARGPAAVCELHARLAASFDLGEQSGAREALAARLAELESAGLVARA
jgi:PqqD family protein of HPr-rel-A system